MRLALLLALLLAACEEASAPWLNPADPPEHADVAIAAAREAVEDHAPHGLLQLDDMAVDITFVDQECIDVDGVCVPAFTNASPLSGLRTFIVIRERYWESVAHELVHCALDYTEGDVDAAHADAAWWGDEDQPGAIKLIVADVGDTMAGLP